VCVYVQPTFDSIPVDDGGNRAPIGYVNLNPVEKNDLQ